MMIETTTGEENENFWMVAKPICSLTASAKVYLVRLRVGFKKFSLVLTKKNDTQKGIILKPYGLIFGYF